MTESKAIAVNHISLCPHVPNFVHLVTWREGIGEGSHLVKYAPVCLIDRAGIEIINNTGMLYGL